MNRLKLVRASVDAVLNALTDFAQRREGMLHIYGVSGFATLLAQRRRAPVELCAVAAMLHDLTRFSMGKEQNHAQEGAENARRILSELGCFSPSEINLICAAIAVHSDKETVGCEVDELLKDADVLQHYCYDPAEPREPIEDKRLAAIFAELTIRL